MPLNKLDNFLKNVEGRILYVSPSDLDATDAMSNQGNSQTAPFKTVQRALIEAARFSYIQGNNNDITEKTTILLMPGEHIIDNRPGFRIQKSGNNAQIVNQSGSVVSTDSISLNLESDFDLNNKDNLLHKFNSVEGGVIVPRGTSIVGLDLRKTKIIPKYVPNPTDPSVPNSAIFRITGACYFWQFSIFDGKETELVYTDNTTFDGEKLCTPTFSHHKLTVFEYADGVNKDLTTSGITDLNMYYYKLSIAYGTATTNRNIIDKFPASTDGFAARRPEFEIVGAFAADPINITSLKSGDGSNVSPVVTVTTQQDHKLDVGTPIKISGVVPLDYNVSSKVTAVSVTNPKEFTYTLESVPDELPATATNVTGGTVTVETDTVGGASPYIFNISLRSVYGMNGMHADGSKATGFRSMVVAQFTGVSLQKDDRAFVKYSKTGRSYTGLSIDPAVYGETLSSQSSAVDTDKVFHLDSDAIYRDGWQTRHVKISNDAVLQIVSVFAIGYGVHFEAQSGSDASITNSNSNFGQLALVSDGFKKHAFEKDDRAFITHIIPPKAITTAEEEIDWISIDIDKTKVKADDKRLYLFGFNSEDIKPPSVTQGFRVGAKIDDELFVNISGQERSAKIFMQEFGTGDPSIVSVKESNISEPSDGVFTSSTIHRLSTGEKVIIISDSGDLPENLSEKTTYFAIRESGTQFKLASSKTNADNEEFINVYKGTNLRVLSRVSDRDSGELGHPVEFDPSSVSVTRNGVTTTEIAGWYINVEGNNSIFNNISSLTGRTEPSYVKRRSDTRSLDDKIYKVRLAIPKEISNSKNPENGFVIQESSSTGFTSNNDFTKDDTLTRADFGFKRNPRFISSCTYNSGTGVITITAEKPHNLATGDLVSIKNVKDAGTGGSALGEFEKGYNGEFTVTNIVNNLTFEYKTTRDNLGANASNNFDVRDTTLPRYERTDLKSNIYLFRNTIVSEYIDGTQDGVYQVFALNSSNSIEGEYSNLNYSQNVVDLYPQLDRDNINENPQASTSFAVRSPLGQVVTNDPLKSLTRETNDKLMRSIGVGASIFSYTDSASTGIVSFTHEHNFAGITTATLTGGANYNPSSGTATYHNVKVFKSTTQNDNNWNGTLAKVIVDNGVVSSFEITNPGSGWTAGTSSRGYFDTTRIGSGDGNAKIDGLAGTGLTAPNIGISSDLVLQFTGIGTQPDSYFRLKEVTDKKQIVIHKSASDTSLPLQNQYCFIVSPSSKISASGNNYSDGVKTIVTSEPHGLVAGNKFQINDASNVNKGSYIVKTKVSVTSFTFESTSDVSVDNGFVLKHGLSANDGISDQGQENLAIRGVDLFDIEHGKLQVVMGSSDSTCQLDLSTTSNLLQRFPYGSYILIDEEIMRVSTNTLEGIDENKIPVIRGIFGTVIKDHAVGSLVKKIKPFPIQFNRPSILRASGHTFEYLGYGPGNYSTALPQVQVKTISEKEEFLSQSQERAGGAVVYTGMNNKGDFYIGNQKKSALTGEETSFDTPIPSVTGENPGRLSVVFDESTIKERLVVEGGKSKTSLSEFDGPVTFNNEVQIKESSLKIKSTTDSTSSTTGSLVVSGGVGIGKTVNLPDDAAIKFGNSGDLLQIFHSESQSTIQQVGLGTLQLKGETVKLIHSGNERLRTTGYGATVTGDIYATNFYGNGAALEGIDNTKLVDDNIATRAQATTSGVVITGITTVNGNIQLTAATPEIELNDGGPRFRVPSANTLSIHTGGGLDSTDNEKMRIDSSGVQVLFNDTATLDVQSTLVKIGDPSEADVTLRVTGDIVAFSSSDRNLKENISPITKALEKVNSINGVTFTKKFDGTPLTGVIAQEIDALGLPGITTTRSSGYMAVDYEKLVPLLIEAIKELSTKVDVLENNINN